jgi:hypothetical protein
MADGDKSMVSGLAISGIGVGAHKALNGIAIGGLAVGTDGNLNGIFSSLAYLMAGEKFRGIAVTGGYFESNVFKGIGVAGYTSANKMNGLSIALFNKADELHGIQFGLLNYVKNNPKGFRILPIINLHF